MPYPIAAETTGLSASGAAMPENNIRHCTELVPPAMSATPTMAPVIACVVETGRPVRDARATHAAAPIATDRGKLDSESASGPTMAEVNVLMSPTEITREARPPANVHNVPQAIAER